MSSVRKNFFYNVLYQVLVLILPLVTAPYIARVLGAENIGIYSYTYSVVYYFMLIAMLGINNYGNREIAKVRNNRDELQKTFTSIYTLQIVMTIFMILIYAIYICIVVKANVNIALIQGIYLISVAFDINWFFFGIEEFKLTVTRNTIIKLLSVISILMFVKKKEDVYIYTLIVASSALISQLALWPFVRKYTKLVKIKVKDVTRHIKQCFILFVPIIAVSLYKIMDKIMLGNMTDMSQVGFYENAEKIINIPMGVITALATVMLPKISNLVANGEKEKIERYTRKAMEFEFISSAALTFGLIAVASIFVPIFLGNEFTYSAILVKNLSVTIIFISLASVIRTQYLIPNEKDKIYMFSVIVGAVLNLSINLILIPKFKAVGATIGTIIAEFSVFAYQTYAVRKELDIKKYLKNGIKYIVLAIIMCIIVSSININIEPIVLLVIKVLLGVVIYMSGLIIIKAVEYKEMNIKRILLKFKNLE
ncbi:MAG: flippase [Clostridia bacterium]|nr:flippase [Clostridia bacterium]